MQQEISKILEVLKEERIAASKVESELGLANGVLGKTAKGAKGLSVENYEKVLSYFEKVKGVTIQEILQVPEPKLDKEEQKTVLVVDEVGIKEKPTEKVKGVLSEAMQKINKDFGSGTVMMFGAKPDNGAYQVISTGSLTLDNALGIGGLPRGRIVEIFGWESSGKSTIALNVIANAQKKKLNCLLVDSENAFDPEYATALGVNVDDLKYCQPSYGEQGLEVADRLMLAGLADVVVIDSVAALVPKAELEGEMGDSKMGLHARLMSQACRKMVNTIAKHNCLCIFINQFRHKIGVMHGSPEVTTGGMALQFYSSIRLEVRRSITKENTIMNGDVKEGNKTTVKVIKNKCSPPFKTATFNILYGTGVDRIGEIVELGVEKGIIVKTGSWYSYNDAKIGQGKESVTELLRDNEEVYKEIEKKVIEAINK